MRKISAFASAIFVLIAFSACNKNTDDLKAPLTTPGGDPPPVVTVNPDLIKDSSLLIARDMYLWNTQIPETFNARSFTDPAAIMKGIRPFSMEEGFNQPVDRWSFAMKKVEWDRLSSGQSSVSSNHGAEGDFGMTVFFRAAGDLRVRLVEPNSPAAAAGIKRGWRITQINGNTNITSANATFIVDNIYNATTASVAFTLPDGNSQTIALTAARYTEVPVYKDTVYQYGEERIGYLVYNSFLGQPAQIRAQFAQVFNRFTAAGVNNMVVDLRYNGGGYVSLAEDLANYLAPASANGGIMMKQLYNAKNSRYNSTTNFRKAGGINLPEIYFIVSKSSASASELLINVLSPYMNVNLIGPSATHGKPVGYSPIPVGDWYVFPISFKTTNKNGEGNYYNGLPITKQMADGLDKDWGDVTESCLASAIQHITTGTYGRPAPGTILQPVTIAGNEVLDAAFIKLTIDK